MCFLKYAFLQSDRTCYIDIINPNNNCTNKNHVDCGIICINCLTKFFSISDYEKHFVKNNFCPRVKTCPICLKYKLKFPVSIEHINSCPRDNPFLGVLMAEPIKFIDIKQDLTDEEILFEKTEQYSGDLENCLTFIYRMLPAPRRVVHPRKKMVEDYCQKLKSSIAYLLN